MISQQLKSIRKSLGYTQKQVAEMLEIAQPTYALYELNMREPNVDTIKKICIIFNCTADELLEIDTPAGRSKIKINKIIK